MAIRGAVRDSSDAGMLGSPSHFLTGRKHDLAKLCKIAQTLSHHSFYNASVPDETDWKL
jgi:hypothetical protein